LKKRIVITGMGTLNAISNNVNDFTSALQKGVCGIGPIDLFDTTGFRSQTGGQIKDFSISKYIPKSISTKRMSRADKFSLAATLEALRNARLYPLPEKINEEVGVSIGGGAGGLLEAEAFYNDYLKYNGRYARFSTLSSLFCASSADRIASTLGFGGPKSTFMTACSAGATAIGYARDLIMSGHASIMITGGVEPMSRLTYAAFNALKSVDPDTCRPFDKNRAGLSLGEAAAIMILEKFWAMA